MSTSKAYTETIISRAIALFISDNKRAPTTSELEDLTRTELAKYPAVDKVGISGYEIYKPQYRDVSSVESENKNRHAAYDDMKTVATRLSDLTELLEDSFRGFQGTASRTNKLLAQLDARIDNLLLLNRNVDVFVQGVEETFDSQENINFETSTAAVESGYCTLGRTGLNTLDLSDVSIVATTTSANNIIGSQTSSDISLLKEEDGSYWEHLVYSRSRQGRVSTIIEISLPSPTFVGDLRFTTSAISVNQKTTATVFYSLDGQTYTALEPAEVMLAANENSFNLGIDNIKKIQIVLSKNVSDNVTVSGNQYVYIFSLDSLKILTDQYVAQKQSILYAGPYSITDEEGNPVNFTKATLSACVNSPEDTSVSFFLSKDNESWESINWKSNAVNVVSFADGSASQSYNFIDANFPPGQLFDSAIGVEEIDFETEALVNVSIDSSFAGSVPIRTMAIKRNVTGIDVSSEIYDTVPGWVFNPETEMYSTTVYVGASEGRQLDVGPTGLKVNGSLRTGIVQLKSGYSVLETDDANWYEISEGVTSLDDLIDNDPLYPYNHKYLVEGYTFPSEFIGEQVYSGVDEYFGQLLEYISPEEFNTLSDTNRSSFKYFTLEDTDGNLYFKVKVDKTDSSWTDERFAADWLVQAGATNEIYVKAELATSNTSKTPVIEDFMIRVI